MGAYYADGYEPPPKNNPLLIGQAPPENENFLASP